MRRATALMSLLAGLALVLWASAPALADDPPGFNGTIKVHAGDTEEEPIRANEPHPGCTFHIHGFNFDGDTDGTWRIVEWSPTGDKTTVSASGTWSADGDGDWRTDVMSLDSGHYKVSADQTSPAAPGGEKHKVFWVECGEQGGGEESPPPGEEQGNVRGPRRGAEETPSPTQAGFQHAAPAVAGQQQAAAPVQVSALPSTSTVAGIPLAGGLILLGLGASLMFRRRT